MRWLEGEQLLVGPGQCASTGPQVSRSCTRAMQLLLCSSEKIMLLCCLYTVMREGSVHNTAWGLMLSTGIH